VAVTSEPTRTTVDVSPSRALIERIASTWKVRQIWLFGSRARGEARAQSDWDLFVVVADEDPAHGDPYAGWPMRNTGGVRSDVILCSETDFADYRNVPNTLAYEAANHGTQVHGG
jgi:hypothetical protein